MFNNERIARLEAAVDDLTKRIASMNGRLDSLHPDDAERRERQINLLSERMKGIQSQRDGEMEAIESHVRSVLKLEAADAVRWAISERLTCLARILEEESLGSRA